jgi:uncharacterized protein (DUF1499 family)
MPPPMMAVFMVAADFLSRGAQMPNKRSRLMIKLPIVLIAAYLLAVLGVRFATPEADVGLVDGSLRDCPTSPNCVSSLAAEFDQEHHVAPLSGAGGGLDALEAILVGTLGATIEERSDSYIHAVITTRLMFFKDDVELHQPAAGGPVQVRSASRLGYSDLGANRARVNALREAYGAP